MSGSATLETRHAGDAANEVVSSDPDRVPPLASTYYPVSLQLKGRSAVVIGGGALAEGKVEGLLDGGANVVVVAATTTKRIDELAEHGLVTLHRRSYRNGDLAGAFLAIAALDSPDERAHHGAIWREAEANRVLLNAVDDAAHCHFIAPAIHRSGAVTVAVSTGGASPALAVQLRDRIARGVGPEYAHFAALLASLRDTVARAIPDARRRAALWNDVVRSNVRALLRRKGWTVAQERIERLIWRAAAQDSGELGPLEWREMQRPRGIVYIVGAGPGAPDLITARGLAALRRADVVVYDRLVDARLLAAATGTTKRVYAGKRPGSSPGRQAAIQRLLVRLARQGKRVVRLKGGDPFVFGRGGEECAALRAAGVRFKVIPGVSSAVAAPAAAGIPVTQRGVASAFVVVSARAADGASVAVDWDAVARMPTVVVLMGAAAVERSVAALLAAGKPAHCPAAVIGSATLPNERTVVGTLGDIARRVADANLRAPATLVVGDVVRLAPALCATAAQCAQEVQS